MANRGIRLEADVVTDLVTTFNPNLEQTMTYRLQNRGEGEIYVQEVATGATAPTRAEILTNGNLIPIGEADFRVLNGTTDLYGLALLRNSRLIANEVE